MGPIEHGTHLSKTERVLDMSEGLSLRERVDKRWHLYYEKHDIHMHYVSIYCTGQMVYQVVKISSSSRHAFFTLQLWHTFLCENKLQTIQ
jgi:hypothetical protein